MGRMKTLAPQKAKNPKKTLLRLFKEVFSDKKPKLFIVFVCLILSALSTVVVSMLLKSLLDDFVIPLIGQTDPDWAPLLKELSFWAVIMALGVGAQYVQARIMIYIAQDSLRDIRNRMFDRLESLPISYFDKNSRGKTMSLFTNDADTLQQMISQSLTSVISSILSVVVVLMTMFMNNWRLTLVMLFSIVTMVASIKVLGRKSSKSFKEQQASVATVNGFVEEMMNGSRVVKVFTHEDESKRIFDSMNESLNGVMVKANVYSNVMGPVSNNIGNIQYVLLVAVGSVMTILSGGAYSVGSLAAFLQLSRSFTNPLSQISQQVNFFLMALAGAERIFTLLDEGEESDGGYVTLVNAKEEDGKLTECTERTGRWAWRHPHKADGSVTYTPQKGDVYMENVNFGYVPGKTVLHDISLYAHPGEKIAFVGATGAGKTTVTNLLNRFYTIESGKIRLDGINIEKIKKSDLRRSLGMILQDTHLFTGTIRENIRFGRLDASDEDVEKAAKLANAHDFIMKMKNGYDTVLENDGEGLSMGQRQLLSIARAAVCDPPVLVMDEATSSIDTSTETLVQKGMDRLMQGRTVFVIAHRLSTVRNSDCIMVLDKGRIIERGTHDELLEKKGTYYKLYTGAFELS